MGGVHNKGPIKRSENIRSIRPCNRLHSARGGWLARSCNFSLLISYARPVHLVAYKGIQRSRKNADESSGRRNLHKDEAQEEECRQAFAVSFRNILPQEKCLQFVSWCDTAIGPQVANVTRVNHLKRWLHEKSLVCQPSSVNPEPSRIELEHTSLIIIKFKFQI